MMATLAAARAWAQDADVTFSTNVKVVSILATVLNKQGQIVRDLAKDDFNVLETAGRRLSSISRAIRTFRSHWA